VYRIDRMLRQLKLAGSFARVRALVFGAFTERGDSDPTGDRPLDDVLGEAAQLVSGPCVAGVPVGHLDAQWTVPLGAMATLDADAQTLNVHDHATVWPMGGK
jgi:muramoyltetrapeptide carboxypeptidase